MWDKHLLEKLKFRWKERLIETTNELDDDADDEEYEDSFMAIHAVDILERWCDAHK